MIQQHIMEKSGKVVTFKDLSNIVPAATKGGTRNDLDVFVNTLRNKYGMQSMY